MNRPKFLNKITADCKLANLIFQVCPDRTGGYEFGLWTSAQDPRLIEIGLRFGF